MTIAFAVTAPSALVIDIARKTGTDPRTLDSGVVLGTDSRFSDARGRLPPDDHGAKLWALRPGVVAVFAGHVLHAERGLQATTSRLKAMDGLTFGKIAESAQFGFQSAVPLNERRGFHRTICLLGVRAPDGATAIIRVGSDDGFTPHFIAHIDAIGERRATVFFRHQMRERLPPAGTPPELWPGGALDMSIEGVGTAASLALVGTIEHIGGSVGGPLQLAYLTARGDEKRALYRGSDGSGTLEFERVTAQPQEIRTFTRPDPRPGR